MMGINLLVLFFSMFKCMIRGRKEKRIAKEVTKREYTVSQSSVRGIKITQSKITFLDSGTRYGEFHFNFFKQKYTYGIPFGCKLMAMNSRSKKIFLVAIDN